MSGILLLLSLTVLLLQVETYNITIAHISTARGRMLQQDATGGRCTVVTRSCCVVGTGCIGSYARVATILDSVRAKNENVLVIDSGDSEGDTVFWTTYKGYATRDLMIAMRFDFKGISTSELFLGPDQLVINYSNQTQFTPIVSNVRIFKDTDSLNAVLKTSAVKNFGDFKVGVLGITLEALCDKTTCSGRLEALPIGTAIQSAVQTLRAQGANLIICISSFQDGAYEATLATTTTALGVDVFVTASTSLNPVDGYPIIAKGSDGRKVPILTAPTFARGVGVTTIQFSGPGQISTATGVIYMLNASVPFQNATAALLDPLEQGMQATLKTIVGVSTVGLESENGTVRVVRLQEVPVGNLVTDALLDAYKGSGANIAMMNSGGIRDKVPAGNITVESILKILPFSNNVATVKIAGSVLYQVMENSVSQVEAANGRFMQVSGMRFWYNPAMPAGIRVYRIDVLSSGTYKTVDVSQMYMIVTNSFERQGGDGYLDTLGNPAKIDISSVFDYGPAVDQVVKNYIAKNTPVAPVVEGRIMTTNLTPASRPLCQYSLDLTKSTDYKADACSGGDRLQSFITWNIYPTLPNTTAAIDIFFDQTVTVLELGKEKLQVYGGSQTTLRAWSLTSLLQQYEGTSNPIPPMLRVYGSAVKLIFTSSTFRAGPGIGFRFVATAVCPAGTYQNQNGLNLDCRTCPAGTFGAATPGKQLSSDVCQPCPAGYISVAGSSTCVPTSPGTFAAAPGSALPQECQIGTFQNSSAATACLACPAGSVSKNIRSTSCDLCAPGTYVSDSGQAQCLHCPIGQYADTMGLSACLSCPNSTSTSSTGSVSLSICQCVPGYFSPTQRTGEICMMCPQNGVCLGGLSLPFAASGSWGDPSLLVRRNGSILDGSFYCFERAPWDRCSPMHENSFFECQSGTCGGQCDLGDVAPTDPLFAACRSIPTNVCSQNSAGRLCTQCADDYFSFGGTCRKCPDKESLKTAAMIGAIVLVLLIWVVINVVASENFPSIDICLFHLQIANIIGRYNMRWGGTLSSLNEILNIANFDVTFATPSCIVDWTYRDSLIFQLTLPIGLGFLNVLRLAVIAAAYKIGLAKDTTFYHAKNRCIRESASFLNVSYSEILIICLNTFYCVELADGTNILRAGPMHECGTSTHKAMMAIAVFGLLIYIVGVPVLIYSILYTGIKKEKLAHEEFMERYSFCYHRYTTRYFYWELLMLSRRFAMSLILVVGRDQPELQSAAAFLVLMMGSAAHFRSMPFIDNRINVLEMCSLYANMIYVIAGFIYFSGNSTKGILKVIDGIVLFCLIGVVFVSFIIYLWALYDMILRNRVTSLLRKHEILKEDKKLSWRQSIVAITQDFAKIMGRPIGDAPRTESEKEIKANLSLKRYGELNKCLRSKPLHKWLSMVQHDNKNVQSYIIFDRAVSPIACDSGETSLYAHTPTSLFFRHLLDTFPNLIFWAAHSKHETVEVFNTILEEIINTLDDDRARKWAETLENQQRAAVLLTLLRSKEHERDSFRELLNHISGHPRPASSAVSRFQRKIVIFPRSNSVQELFAKRREKVDTLVESANYRPQPNTHSDLGDVALQALLVKKRNQELIEITPSVTPNYGGVDEEIEYTPAARMRTVADVFATVKDLEDDDTGTGGNFASLPGSVLEELEDICEIPEDRPPPASFPAPATLVAPPPTTW